MTRRRIPLAEASRFRIRLLGASICLAAVLAARPAAQDASATPQGPASASVVGGDSASGAATSEAAASSGSAGGPLAVVRLDGLRRTKPEVVRRTLATRPGVAFSDSVLAADLDRLERLDIFADVRARRSGDTLVLSFEELPWIVPTPSGRLSDEEGLSLGGGFVSLNLFGRDIHAEFLTLFGGTTEWQASASSPWMGDMPLGWEVFTSRTDKFDDLRNFQELSYRSFVRLSWPGEGLHQARVSAEGLWLHSDRPGVTLTADRSDWIPSLEIAGIRDSRDRHGLTRRGGRHEVFAALVGGPLGGPSRGARAGIDNRLWLDLGGRWGLNLQHLLEFQPGRHGAYQDFLIGGANTLRGHEPGVLRAANEQIGGVELRYLVLPPRVVRLFGLPLDLGLQAGAGLDAAAAVGRGGWKDRAAGAYLTCDILLPSIDRLRISVGSPIGEKPALRIDAGLFEKSLAQRFRVR